MLDDNIRSIWNNRNSVLWCAFENNDTYGYYYAENRIYLIRNMKTDALSIVTASNPKDALSVVIGIN